MTFLGSAAVSESFQNNARDTYQLSLPTVAGFFYDGTHSDALDLQNA
jgi:hypothetical protein